MADHKTREDYMNDPVFQRLQFLARAAFEQGWRAGGGDPVSSPFKEPAVGWRLAWLKSEARAFLVENGLINGDDTWK